MNNLFMLRRILPLYHNRSKISLTLLSSSSSSSSKAIYSRMKGLIDSKQYEKALSIFDQESHLCKDIEINMALKACINLKDYQRGMNIQKKLSQNSLENPYIQTTLIQFYMQFDDTNNASRLFSAITNKSNYIYVAMFKGLISNNMSITVLDLFDEIKIQPNEATLALVFRACTRAINDRAMKTGRNILNQMPKTFLNDNILLTSAINMLMKFGDVQRAEDLFKIIKKKDIITYGAMMKGYVENSMSDKALDLFEQISLNLDSVIYTIIFNACAQLHNDRAIKIGKKLLDEMPNNYEKDNNINNSAIDMLMKFGDVKSAENLFEAMKRKDIITYGAMMKGYVENNMNEKVLDLFEQIPLSINNVIYTIIFNACAQLCNDRARQIGRKLLDEMPKKFIQNNYIYSSAIDMLMRFGDVQRAEDLFKMIEKKDSISYGIMINGCNINNEPLKSLELFEEMKESDINVDVTVLIKIIGACARIGMLSICQSVVAQIPLDLYKNRWICNSLIDMWGKAGSIKNAQEIFESIDTPDIITYTSMINAFGLNRMGLEATDLYRKISNSLHDEILYICVLNACSHSGLLYEAYSIFNEIHHKTAKIITTMIDCLSRLFLFDEAQKLIEDYETSNPPCSAMYMAILSGARNSRNSIVSEKIYERMKLLFQNEKDTLTSGSILLSNIYSSLGQHEEAQHIRLNRIKQVGKKVQPGLAWTEKDGEIAQFTAHDQSHRLSKEIYAEADRISCELTEHGHKSDSSWITRPLAETETIQSVLCSHSERLAIAFHFIQGRKPSFIQITENLRVCGDCHQATKLIAKIRQVKIVVRDANCIHHFSTNGTCSCQDHF
ncbi:unnamed protein product [Adineta steineri]|uniref:DYW domain-containing protein n=1 Tax=Adineta steineri TaxID=433720 RepID=A0A815HQB9_9BILA|nr:unnamed protein product [Adineta steineri]CAF1355672.1 unnamed protein product [Adineta steineri]